MVTGKLLYVASIFLMSAFIIEGESIAAARDIKLPYHETPLRGALLPNKRIQCEAEDAASTGYYLNPSGGTDLVSTFSKQKKKAEWHIVIEGETATSIDDQGNVNRYRIVKYGPDGISMAELPAGRPIQMITIDPRSSSFVYTTQNVHWVWNRVTTFVGRCRIDSQ